VTAGRDALVALARETCTRAHAPYSGIHVAAAIRSAAGAVYAGTNVENAGFRIAETAVWASVDDLLPFAFELPGMHTP
jgi:cytidine deaminase